MINAQVRTTNQHVAYIVGVKCNNVVKCTIAHPDGLAPSACKLGVPG